MRTLTHGRLQVFPGAQRAGERSPRWMVTAFAAALAILAAVAVALATGAERRALRALPDAQRRTVMAHTMEDLRSICGDGRPDALAPHCRELASLAASFEECTGECAALVQRQLVVVPTR